MSNQLNMIPLECLQRGKYQPRQTFDPKALQELAQSIKAQGLIEPLVVRNIAPDQYEIIAGERRWRAAMLTELTELPCIVGNYSDRQAAAVTLIENIQRQDLNLLEEAQGYQRLLDEFQFTQDEVATLIGKSRSHIANILRLLTLCPSVQERLRAQQLTLGHARMLVGLTLGLQASLATKAIEQDWSVRKLEDEVRGIKKQASLSAPSEARLDIAHLQTRLAEQMGTPVQIDSDGHSGDRGGWLKIKYFDNDTLSGLLERMGLSYD